MTSRELTIGSCCSGYGGLDLAAEAVFGARTVWHCEVDAAASRVLVHRWPGVPNHGDVTAIIWDAYRVDILTAGYPCQPFSHAGQRKGTEDERHLWPHIAEAIRRIRPRYVVLENVAGHRTLGLDAVLGDLAAARYDTRWTSVRASDVGAPHQRERIFILASDADAAGWVQRDGSVADGPQYATTERRGAFASDPDRGRLVELDQGLGGVPFADSSGVSAWGEYEPAIRRWEGILGRSAPPPTHQLNGLAVLNPRAEEWMMGLPAGWVTDVPGLSRNDMLKILGNGVVPQQAEAALRALLVASEAAA